MPCKSTIIRPPASKDIRKKWIAKRKEAGAVSGGASSSTDAHIRGCGEADGGEAAVAERSSGQTAGAMTEEYILGADECTNQITLGDWTACGEHEYIKVNLGVCCGNWTGGCRYSYNPQKQERMIREVLSSIGHIYCFQGAEEHLCDLLMLPRSGQPDEDFRDRGRTSRKKGKVQRDQRWYVVRGPEKGPTTAVAVRTWPFKGIRRECFILADAGDDDNKRMKFNRTLFVTLKFNKNY